MKLKAIARSLSERAILGKRASNFGKVCYALDERAIGPIAWRAREQFFACQFKNISDKNCSTRRNFSLDKQELLARRASNRFCFGTPCPWQPWKS